MTEYEIELMQRNTDESIKDLDERTEELGDIIKAKSEIITQLSHEMTTLATRQDQLFGILVGIANNNVESISVAGGHIDITVKNES